MNEYLRALRNNSRTPDLRPINRGEEMCKPGHFWGAGMRLNCIMHYVIGGKGEYQYNGVKYKVGKGQAFFIFADTVVKYVADEYDPWHYVWVEFKGDDAMYYLEKAGVTPSNPVISVRAGDELVRLLRAMPNFMGLSENETLTSTALLFNVFSLLIEKDETKKSENYYFDAAVKFVRRNISRPVSVEEVSAEVGISRKYLYVVFEKACKMSPKEFIIDYKMKKACEFLKNNDLTISNISYSVGYPDPLLFSKIFKSRFGVSPLDYRKKL